MGVDVQHRALVAALGLALAAAGPAAAGCRLALAIGFDVSRSIDGRDYAIQKEGTVAALTAPEIRDALLDPPDHVAIAIYEWSGKADQRVAVPWIAVRTEADLDALVAAVVGHERGEKSQQTALGEALAFGRDLLAAGEPCEARTLDMVGDGQNNEGRSPDRVYAEEAFGDITVNGLPIADHEQGVTHYYETEVIRGPGAFIEPAPRQKDFPRAFRRKLQRELSVRLLGQAGGDGGPG